MGEKWGRQEERSERMKAMEPDDGPRFGDMIEDML
jgi:hypothetical protein